MFNEKGSNKGKKPGIGLGSILFVGVVALYALLMLYSTIGGNFVQAAK